MSENPTDQQASLTIEVIVKPIIRYWFNQLTRKGLTVGEGEIEGHDFKSILLHLPSDTLYFRYQLTSIKVIVHQEEEYLHVPEVTERSGKHFVKGETLPYSDFTKKFPRTNTGNLNPENLVLIYIQNPLSSFKELFYEEFRPERDVLVNQIQ